MLRTTWAGLAAVLSLMAAEAVLYGFSYPFFTLALERRGVADGWIGLNASIAGAGILLAGPLLPMLVEQLGLRRLVALQFATATLAFAALLMADAIVVWFAARLVMGTCFASLWTTTEIWLNRLAPEEARGRLVGLSGAIYATFQAAGPLLLGVTGAAGAAPILAAVAPLAAAAVLALAIRTPVRTSPRSHPSSEQSSLRDALRLAGPVMAASFTSGIGETAMQGLLPLWGLSRGLGEASASGMVAVFVAGKALLALPLGLSADRFGRRGTLIAATLAAVMGGLMLPFAGNGAPVAVALLLAGGTMAGLYTLGLVLIGQDFTGRQLTVVSTGFAMAYSAGAVLGATPAALAMDAFGPNALPLGLALVFALLALGLAFHRPGRTVPAKIDTQGQVP